MGIPRVPHRRDDGTAVPLLFDSVPVDARKEGVSFDLGRAAADVAEAAGAVDSAKLADDVLCWFADGRVGGEDDGFFYYSERGEVSWVG